MKRHHIAAMLMLQSLSVGAFAQSSVTIYGSVDNGISYVSNIMGHSVVKMQDGINKSNALGFTGTEDLGGGLRSFFKLENGFSLNTGAMGQGLIFGKQAYVGLGKSGIGDVSLGRQYDYTLQLERYMSPFLNCGIMVFENGDLDRTSGERLNNSAQFNSASFGGATFGAMYSFGQNAGTASTNEGRAYSGNVQYSYGPFSGALVVTDINKAPVYAGLTGAPTLLGHPLTPATVLLVDNQRILGAAGMYTFDKARVSAIYTNTQLQLSGHSETDQVVYVGGDYRLRPDVALSAKVSYDKLEDSHWYSLNMAADYQLSKQTDVYLELAGQKAGGATGTVASIATMGPSSTDKQFVSRVGLRHFF
ncbi:porin [Paraburkholderia dinghuensis]|uniref:Porin n=1 Tax=Paraburkholderia dinghuensis TaxID=2305225 RepID=A0A3N6N8H3_9BURK|nr:porin [Paraburkholderia dinghuensis]RQH04397.1 porin [Paraburkholderia dinghuensis]